MSVGASALGEFEESSVGSLGAVIMEGYKLSQSTS